MQYQQRKAPLHHHIHNSPFGIINFAGWSKTKGVRGVGVDDICSPIWFWNPFYFSWCQTVFSSHFSLILGYRLLHPVQCDYITIRWTNKFVAWHSKAVSNFSFRPFNQ